MKAEIVREGFNVGLFISQLMKHSRAETTRRVLLAAQYAAGKLADKTRSTFTKRPRGDLARSWRPSPVEFNGDEVSSIAHSDLIYARKLDEGGYIYPRNMKNLAVPVNDQIPIGKWPRHFGKGELTLIVGKKGPYLAKVAGKGKRAKVTPMYALKESVYLEPTGYIEEARKDAEPGVEHILDEGVIKAIDEASK